MVAYEVCMKEGIEGGKKEVCYGAIHDMTISLIPSLAAGVLSPQRVCDEVLHLCKSPEIKELSSDQYVKQRIDSKPDIIKNNTFVDDIYKKIKESDQPREIIRSI
jgi:hypothetical protein